MAQPYQISRETREEAIFFGDGGSGYGPFALKIFDVADVEVWTKAVDATEWTLATTTVTKTTGLAFDTFSIVFAYTVPVTTRIKVLCARVHERSAGVTSGTKISTDALEKELTKQGTILQELRRDADRAVKSDFGINAYVIADDLADGETLMKSGQRLVKGPNASEIAAAQGYALTAVSAKDAAQAWAEGTEPGGVGTKSSMEWAEAALAATIFNVTRDPIVGDGVTTIFLLSVEPVSKNNVFITWTGLVQETPEYNIVGQTIVFTEAPAFGVTGEARVIANNLSLAKPADASVNPSSFSASAVTYLDDRYVTRSTAVFGSIMPIIKGSSIEGSCTYSIRRGTYRETDGMVYFNAEADWTGHSGAGDIYFELEGAPVSANIDTPCSVQIFGATFSGSLSPVILKHTNVIFMNSSISGGGISGIAIPSAGTVRVSGMYPKSANSDILFMGDSVTYGVRPGVTESDTFRFKVQNELRWALAHNGGIGGENASEMEARFVVAFATASPQAVCLMSGINDFYDPLDVVTFQMKLQSMVDYTLSQGVSITLCSCNPTTDPVMLAGFGPWLAATQAVGATAGVIYVPVYETFMNYKAAHGDVAFAALFTDGQHPNAVGHDLIVDTIRATAGACLP